MKKEPKELLPWFTKTILPTLEKILNKDTVMFEWVQGGL